MVIGGIAECEPWALLQILHPTGLQNAPEAPCRAKVQKANMLSQVVFIQNQQHPEYLLVEKYEHNELMDQMLLETHQETLW